MSQDNIFDPGVHSGITIRPILVMPDGRTSDDENFRIGTLGNFYPVKETPDGDQPR